MRGCCMFLGEPLVGFMDFHHICLGALCLIFAYGTEHNADFRHKKCGEDEGKDAGGGQHMAAAQTADAGIHREKSLNGPGLTPYFGDNPSALSGNVYAGQRQKGGIVEGLEPLKLLLVAQP